MPRKTIPEMVFADIYPLLVKKAERKGRTRDATAYARSSVPSMDARTYCSQQA